MMLITAVTVTVTVTVQQCANLQTESTDVTQIADVTTATPDEGRHLSSRHHWSSGTGGGTVEWEGGGHHWNSGGGGEGRHWYSGGGEKGHNWYGRAGGGGCCTWETLKDARQEFGVVHRVGVVQVLVVARILAVGGGGGGGGVLGLGQMGGGQEEG